MPASGGGFEQSYNAQASVDVDTMLVVGQHLTQNPNDKLEIELSQAQSGERQTLLFILSHCLECSQLVKTNNYY